MERENKKEDVAALHREKILEAAHGLFCRDGFAATSITGLSAASHYSRRTIYAYFESKEDILHHLIEKGLLTLKTDLKAAVSAQGAFADRLFAVFRAIGKYQGRYPISAENVQTANADLLQAARPTAAQKRILVLGEDINRLLAAFIEDGKRDGAVRQSVISPLAVQILYAGVSALYTLADSKTAYLQQAFALSREEFLLYGFRQLADSILEVRS